MSIQVAVIGGGVGGLCLAQGLVGAGVSVTVYERDRTPRDRLQGYRLHINPHGARALHECLPAALWERFVATTGRGGDGFGFLDKRMRPLLSVVNPGGVPERAHHSVSRVTLREILLTGLDDVVRFGRRFVRYEQVDGRILVHFADGSTAWCDVLVGADGANSAVRGQYLPHARRVDTGITAVAGKLPLTAETRAWLPPMLVAHAHSVIPRSGGMFLAPHELASGGYLMWAYAANGLERELGPGVGQQRHESGQRQAAGPGQESGPDPRRAATGKAATGKAVADSDGARFRDLDSRRAAAGEAGFGGAKSDAPGFDGPGFDGLGFDGLGFDGLGFDGAGFDGAELRRVVADAVAGWHPDFLRIVRETPGSEVACWPIRTSVPVAAWPATSVTLLGDAIHSMTPMRGIGANTALRDAELLCRNLVERAPVDGIADYERRMREYGFAAVKASLRSARQFVSGGVVGRAAFRSVLRLFEAVPPVKRAVFRDHGID